VAQSLAGPTAIAYSVEDAVAPAKLLAQAAEEHEELAFKGALLEGRFLSVEETVALSKMPGRDELMAQVAGALQSPLMGIYAVYQSIVGGLVYTLQAYAEREEGDSSS